MKDYMRERSIKAGKLIADKETTIRGVAKQLGVSKSTIHKDVVERLPKINPLLADKVRGILDYHKRVRAIRGGAVTKRRYENGEIVRKRSN